MYIYNHIYIVYAYHLIFDFACQGHCVSDIQVSPLARGPRSPCAVRCPRPSRRGERRRPRQRGWRWCMTRSGRVSGAEDFLVGEWDFHDLMMAEWILMVILKVFLWGFMLIWWDCVGLCGFQWWLHTSWCPPVVRLFRNSKTIDMDISTMSPISWRYKPTEVVPARPCMGTWWDLIRISQEFVLFQGEFIGFLLGYHQNWRDNNHGLAFHQ